MSAINFIIAKKDDLKSLIYTWLDEHAISKSNSLNEKPMSRVDIAEYLGVSTVTITEWMKKGLPHKRLNGRVYFMRDEVMESMHSFKKGRSSLSK